MTIKEIDQITKERLGFSYEEALDMLAKASIEHITIALEEKGTKHERDNVRDEKGRLSLAALGTAFEYSLNDLSDKLNELNKTHYNLKKLYKDVANHKRSWWSKIFN